MSQNLSTATITSRYSSFLPYIVVGLASLFYVYDYFIQVAPSVMTDELMLAFGIGASGLGVLGASFYYSYTLMQIPAGLLLDRLGARVLLTFSVFISACGVTLFGLTHSFFLAGFSRFLIGLGSAFAFISALFLISRWFKHRHFALIAGLIQLAGCLGSMFGEAPLALTINHYGWRSTMIVIGLFTFLLTIIFWGCIRNGHPNQPHQSSLTGHGELHRLKTVLSKSQVWWVAGCGLVSWVPVATIGALWGIPYLMKVYGWTNTYAGFVCSAFWLGLGLGSPFMGWWSTHVSRRVRPLIICFSLGFVSSITLLSAHLLPVWCIVAALFFLGVSASVQSLSFGIIKDIIPHNMFGTAAGFNNMAAIIGGAISQPLVGVLLDVHWVDETLNGIPVYSLADYRFALYLLPVSAVVGILIAKFGVKETYCKQI